MNNNEILYGDIEIIGEELFVHYDLSQLDNTYPFVQGPVEQVYCPKCGNPNATIVNNNNPERPSILNEVDCAYCGETSYLNNILGR